MLSDQKHENAGELRLRPAETMKANTGNGKLPAQKDEKAVIASYKGPRVEKYRGYPVWANTGMNKKKKKDTGAHSRTETSTFRKKRQERARQNRVHQQRYSPKTADYGFDISVITDVTVICSLSSMSNERQVKNRLGIDRA